MKSGVIIWWWLEMSGMSGPSLEHQHHDDRFLKTFLMLYTRPIFHDADS